MYFFLLFLTIATFKVTKADTEGRIFNLDTPKYLECDLPLSCVPLPNCKTLMSLIKTSENIAATRKFLNGQLCGHDSKEGPKVCCPENTLLHKSIKKDHPDALCNPPLECVELVDCSPLVHLIRTKKISGHRIIKFIKSRQCELDPGSVLPKVCCEIIGKAKIESKDIDLFEKEEDEEGDSFEEKKEVVSTESGAMSTRTLSLEQKGKFLNKFFNSDHFDFWLFDLFVRRRK